MSKINNFTDLPKIVAVDFDGTIVEDNFPKIGKPNMRLINDLQLLRKQGVKLVLWTSRNFSNQYGDLLEEAVVFCENLGLRFDAINENITEVQELTGEDTRKVYADLYIDDKAVPACQDPLYWAGRLGIDWFNDVVLGEMRCQEKAQL